MPTKMLLDIAYYEMIEPNELIKRIKEYLKWT
jgi:hypothetical protein